MGREKRKFLMIAGLLISGLIPLWTTSLQKATSKTIIIGESKKNHTQKKQETINKLSSIEYLSLPTRSKDLTITTLKKINLNQLEKILINNNQRVKVYLRKIDQAKSILKSSLSAWYPTLNLTANGIPQYFESNNYNESNLISDTSS